MDLREYQLRLQNLAIEAKNKAVQSVIVPAANKLLAKKKNTIQKRGEKTDGGKIGDYSTRPAYFTADQFDKGSAFKPVGKGGFKGKKIVSDNSFRVVKRKLKNGNVEQRLVSNNRFVIKKTDVKSMYLPNGYKQLRQIQGKGIEFIDETYTGSTMASYILEPIDNGAVIGFDNEKASIIRKAQEKRFGKIFYAQNSEMEAYNKEVQAGMKDIILKLLKNA